MDTERWRRISALYHEAQARSAVDGAAFLRDACAGDEDLRREVESLLAQEESEATFLARPAVELAARPLFAPGEVFAGRYRIVSLLGTGGMGDVYRADDLRVGQPVALKFISPSLSAHTQTSERLVRELRLARQIAHPNVCRLYDIGEWNGRSYLSMEYIDGENLGSLLTRVGRLTKDKALDVAHQLCAGLEAAHACGVLHLDLKPANVMIDGRGRALITDFGVARSIGEAAGDALGGTPGYMAPEQRRQGRLTVQTDLYALGLLMFEMYTGLHPHDADSATGRGTPDDEAEPLPPSRFVRDLEPRVEEVIVACLQHDMASRPPSAIAVATALPGGGPLAAALAAGRLLSPETVAAVSRDAIAPLVAWLLAASVVSGVAGIALLNRDGLRQWALQLSPPVLVARAQEILRSLGYDRTPSDTAYWFSWKESFARQRADREPGFRMYDVETQSADGPRFVHRQSPGALVPGNAFGVVLYRDPPADVPGMADVNLDPAGDLLRLVVIPGARAKPLAPAGATPDWAPLLDRAGLRADALMPVEPSRTPPVPYDSRAEWETTHPRMPGARVRVAAALFDQKPVYFDIDAIEPVAAAPSTSENEQAPLGSAEPAIITIITVVTIVCALVLARRNLLQGHADRRGAVSLALYIFTLSVASIVVLRPDHIADFVQEYSLLARLLGLGLYWSALTAVLYVAFEPHVRRRWPAMLIGWNRIVAGRLKDPIVGRDLLIGTAGGVAMVGVLWLAYGVSNWMQLPASRPFYPRLEAFREIRHLAALIVFIHGYAVGQGLVALVVLLSLRLVLRAEWLALAAWIGVMATAALPGFDWRIGCAASITGAALSAVVMRRFGLVALSVMWFTSDLLIYLPVALESSAWYAGRSLTVTAIPVAVSVYGAYMAAGGRAHPRSSDRPILATVR